MYLGRVAEYGDATVFSTPRPYTKALLCSIPNLDFDQDIRLDSIRGMVPDPYRPAGSPLHPRCCYAVDRCAEETPSLCETADGHDVACHLADEIELAGIHGQSSALRATSRRGRRPRELRRFPAQRGGRGKTAAVPTVPGSAATSSSRTCPDRGGCISDSTPPGA